MAKIRFENFWLDHRTAAMLVAARVICKAPLVITQGSYNTTVAASGGTHSGGGALDLRATNLTAAQRKEAVACLRRVGFAAWLRTPAQSDWPYHIHAIAIGCPDLSRTAKAQVTDYLNGKNGLASHGTDDGPRTWVSMTWEKYAKAHPDLLTEPVPVTPDTTEDDMPLTTADLDAVQARAYKANSDYAIAFWVSEKGTGTAIRNLLAAMKQQLDRIEDDTDGAAATAALLEKIDASVETLKAEALADVPKV